MMFVLTWGTLAYFHWFTHDEVRRVIVSNSLGETAELSGDGLTFRSATGTPLVWLTATQRPVLAMGLGTGPLYIALGVETLGNPPHGYVTLHGETREGKLTPEGFK